MVVYLRPCQDRLVIGGTRWNNVGTFRNSLNGKHNMKKTKLSFDKRYCTLTFTKGGEGNVKNAEELAESVRNAFPGSNTFFVVKPMSEEGKVVVHTDGMDSWRKAIYAMSEGEIWVGDIVGTDKYKVVRRQFVTNSPLTLANIVISMLAKDLPHTHVQEAEDAAEVWRPATPEEENDPTIKWEMEGSSKYGRRMINRERRIYRGLTMSEFYGGGIVD